MSRSIVLATCLLAVWGLAGCGSAEKTAVWGEVDVADLMKVPGERVYHEWKQIYSADIRGKTVTRKRVGYLDRVYSDEDSAGKFFVRDRKHDERGFLLPGGKAFVLEQRYRGPDVWTDLGNTGFNNGVKKILGVPGRIQFEPVPDASTSPTPEE